MGRFIAVPGILLVCLLLAACVHTDSNAPAASVQYTLAVFPWNIVDGGLEGVKSEIPPFDVTMRAFQHVVTRSAFVPVFSYYALHESTTTIKERPGIASLWGGRSVMSNPDHEIAFQLGAQLGVDAVITYAVSKQHSVDDLSVYLFDIPAKRVYSAYDKTGRFAKDGPAVLTVMTRRVFTEFLKNRA